MQKYAEKYDRLERETRVTSNNFFLYLYIYIYIYIYILKTSEIQFNKVTNITVEKLCSQPPTLRRSFEGEELL